MITYVALKAIKELIFMNISMLVSKSNVLRGNLYQRKYDSDNDCFQ